MAWNLYHQVVYSISDKIFPNKHLQNHLRWIYMKAGHRHLENFWVVLKPCGNIIFSIETRLKLLVWTSWQVNFCIFLAIRAIDSVMPRFMAWGQEIDNSRPQALFESNDPKLPKYLSLLKLKSSWTLHLRVIEELPLIYILNLDGSFAEIVTSPLFFSVYLFCACVQYCV